MNNQIRVLRLLEYTGSAEDVAKHLANRGVKEISHPQWDGGKVTIRESFIENRLGGWEAAPVESKPSSSFELAMNHLKQIDELEVMDTVRKYFGEFPTDPLDLLYQTSSQSSSQSPASQQGLHKSRNKTSGLDHLPSAKD